MNYSEKDLFLFFFSMFERQELFYNRFYLKLPKEEWTTDKHYKDRKFTNVYRELDRQSQWIINNVILDENNTDKDILWKIIIFRRFNLSDLFEACGLPSYHEYKDKDKRLEWTKKCVDFSEKNVIINSAYLMNVVHGFDRFNCKTREEVFLKCVLPLYFELLDDLFENISDLNYFINTLSKKFLYFANFMAYEIFLDLTYVFRYTDRNFFIFDENDFVNAGPGAKCGLSFIFPKITNVFFNRNGKTLLKYLRDISYEYLSCIGDFKYLSYDKQNKEYIISPGVGSLTLHQIEMWLCEYSKYYKMENSIGKQRPKFR